MATYYIDPVNGIDTQSGLAPVQKTGCTVTSASTTVTVPNNTGLVVGMGVFATDLLNSGNLFSAGTVISAISGTTITISAAATGSSANASVIFSPAKKTFGNITGSLNPGDSVRFLKSPDAVNTGLTGNWAKGSITVSCTPDIVEIDNCDLAWTPVAGVTCTVNSTDHYQGSGCISIGTGTVSGKLAYKQLSSLNLTGFSRLSFWWYAPTTSGTFSINLCSDATGDVPVYSATVQTLPLASGVVASSALRFMTPIVVDFGTNLTTQINSISISRTGSTTSGTVRVDNIFACKSESSSSAITLRSAIGRNVSGDTWYKIRSISSTGIDLLLDSSQGYLLDSATSPIYRKEPLVVLDTAQISLSRSGTSAAPITISGGWDVTTMSSQTGDTWLHETQSGNNSERLTLSGSFIRLERVGYVGGTTFTLFSTVSGNHISLSGTSFIGCRSGITATLTVDKNFIAVTGQDISMTQAEFSGSLLALRGFNEAAAYRLIDIATKHRVRLLNCKLFNQSRVFSSYDGMNLDVRGCSIYGGILHAATTGSVYRNETFADCTFRSLKFGAFSGLYVTPAASMDKVLFKNCFFDADFGGDSAAEIDSNLTVTNSAIDAKIKFHAFNGVSTDHRIYTPSGVVRSNTSITHTPGGISWRIQPQTPGFVVSESPIALGVAKIYVQSGVQTNAKIWVYKTSANIEAGLRVKLGAFAGLSEEKRILAANLDNQWQQITLFFTPTASGIVEIEAFAYGGTTDSAYFDDFSTI